MDEFERDDGDNEDFIQEDEVQDELVEGEEEQTEQQKAETADVMKLFKQHPEIWIPYEEQIQERLNINPPGELTEFADLPTSLRDLSLLDAKHTTYPFLNGFEKPKCIAFRARQIDNGAKPYVLVPSGVTDSYLIAKMELEARRLPLIVKRPMPDGTYEVWRLNDLLLL